MNIAMQSKASDHRLVVAQTQEPEQPLRDYVRTAVDNYFSQLNGHTTSGLYQMVIAEVEKPLLEAVLRQAESNQTRAAKILGISRSTLRKKLAKYNLD
jgi:Fis family transcriptional regulator